MADTISGKSLHPVLWIAAVAVILFSLAGIGAIMGFIPTAGSTASAPANAATSAPAALAATAPAAAEPAPGAAPKPAKPKTVPAESRRIESPAPVARAPVVVAQAPQAAEPVRAPICPDCGVIESVREIKAKGEGSGLGAVGGAVVGGLLGSQIGKGRGNSVATVAGAVGGAVAGHQVEKHYKSTTSYEVVVRMEDGSTRVVPQNDAPVWRGGERVRIDNGVIVSRN